MVINSDYTIIYYERHVMKWKIASIYYSYLRFILLPEDKTFILPRAFFIFTFSSWGTDFISTPDDDFITLYELCCLRSFISVCIFTFFSSSFKNILTLSPYTELNTFYWSEACSYYDIVFQIAVRYNFSKIPNLAVITSSSDGIYLLF